MNSIAVFAFIKIGFLEIRIWDVLDILLVAILLYQVYKLLKGSLAFNILIGFLMVYLLYLLVDTLEMSLLSGFFNEFIKIGFLTIFIVFQPEIRRFLLFLGRGSGIGERKFWNRLFARKVKESTMVSTHTLAINRAVQNLSQAKLGALIVFTQSTQEYYFGSTGVVLDAEISSKLIESIFQKTSPLHDGAMVIAENKIYAANCVLPVSENPDLPSRIGMRHKAAVGITEKIEAHVIIVSEETGKISIAHKGRLRRNVSQQVLQTTLNQLLNL